MTLTAEKNAAADGAGVVAAGTTRNATNARSPSKRHRCLKKLPMFEMDDSGFERIIDDEETGDLFKDAYRQEAIVDKVRAVEFDIEPTTAAEVGSLLATVTESAGGFERIADEDDDPQPAKPKRKPAKSNGKSRWRRRSGNARSRSG